MVVVAVADVAGRLVRAGSGLAWRGTAGPGRGGKAELGQVGSGGRAGPGRFRGRWCGGCCGPAWWPGGGWPAGGAQVPGGAERGGGLGGALLGLAPLRDGFSECGQSDQEHDWGEGAVPGEVGVGGDEPGGVAELVPGRGRGGYPAVGLAGGAAVVVGGSAQGAAAERGGGCVQRVGGGVRGVGGSGRVPGRRIEPDPVGRVGDGTRRVLPQRVSLAWCQRGVRPGRAGPPLLKLGPAQVRSELAAPVPHPGTDIDARAAAALDDADLHATQRRIGELYDHNLISEPTRGRYRLHDLLREHARVRAVTQQSPAENEAAIVRLLDYYLATATAASRHVAGHHRALHEPGRTPACAPQLRTEAEAITWLATERPNLHACAGFAAAHTRLEHAVQIPAAISHFLRTRGHWTEAATLAQAALAAARTADDEHGQAISLGDLGLIQELTGTYPAATASQQQALRLYRDLGDQRGQAWALNHLGTLQRLTGDYPASTASQTQALRLFHDLGDLHGQGWALGDIGAVQQLTADYPAATASLTAALHLFHDSGDRHGQAWALNHLGTLQRLTGDYPASTASQTQALRLFRDLGDRHGQGWALADLGAAQFLTGNYPAATASLTKAVQLYRDLGNRHGQADASINLANLLCLTTARHHAGSHHADALTIAREINAPLQQARALEGTGQCHHHQGNHREAASHLQQALAIYQRIASPDVHRVQTILRTRHP